MQVDPQILIFAGSLIAILLLTGFAALLKLGGTAALGDESAVRRVISEIADDFEPVDVALDRGGGAALALDGAGRVMLVKRHGNKFAGRILGPAASVQVDGDMLKVFSGERRYGMVELAIDDAAAWAEAIESVRTRSHA